jgi:CO/xanthine dehydrogenase Mo-binding subunit
MSRCRTRHAAFVRSPHAHARIRSIDARAALAVPGVLTVLTGADAVADDVGRAVNPMILHGQTHGGIAAGVGQALWEHCRYDPETGQMQSATLMDYALPRADNFPSFTTQLSEVPSTSNPLGLRGGGEGGTTPALAAVVNAIVDALEEFGVEHIELPATPERICRAIRGRALTGCAVPSTAPALPGRWRALGGLGGLGGRPEPPM